MKCVVGDCKEPATEGSYQHPFCKAHFKEKFDNSQKAYTLWMVYHHHPHHDPYNTWWGAITFIIGLTFLIALVIAVVGLAIWGLISLCS